MKKLLLILLLGGVGYWSYTGAAATEWKAFRFWYGHHEALPMLEARAEWVLGEMDDACPTIEVPPMNRREALALAKRLSNPLHPGTMPGDVPAFSRAQIEEHRDRSASLASYAEIREAASKEGFVRMEHDHMSMLGERLDSDHRIMVWQELARVPSDLSGNGEAAGSESIAWMVALNLSTRERIASALYLTKDLESPETWTPVTR